MTGLELVKSAMRCNEVPRIPWVPFVGAHAGALLNISATEYLSSTGRIEEGVKKAVSIYKPDGIPVAFDLQVEAEALGCKLNWMDDNPPAVVSHPLLEGVKLEELQVPGPDKARIPLMMDAARRLRADLPDIALYGLITGPFTLALHLMGTDLFMRMLEDPGEIHALMRFSTDTALMMTREYIDAGCDIIAVVDPMTSQIDPMSFETFVSPYVSEIFNKVREMDALSSFFVCGFAQHNIEAMCDCGPDNISIDENIPLDFVRDVALSKGVSFGGNIKLTVSLLMGTEEDSQRDALQCMDTGGKKGFILAPGCDLAMDTPQVNIEAVTRLVHDELLQGELRAAKAKVHDVKVLDLSSHWKSNKVVIDIITLDSSSCAPCKYMVDAVARACETLGESVEYREYRIKDEEGIRMMASLGVMQIPTIVMDGNIEFISHIPPIREIRAKIEEYMQQKKL